MWQEGAGRAGGLTVMTAREELLRSLEAVLPAEPGIAVIHSSFPALLPPDGFAQWDALYPLAELAARGWTVALPAFTFSFCGGKPFSLAESASETGIYADWLLANMAEAVRTPHPIYSFAAIGPRAAEIAACPSTTAFGDDSPFGLFEREGATVVMLGAGWEYCTSFHRCEEKAGVPYRYQKSFDGQVDLGGGAVAGSATMFVRDLAIDPINDFSPAVSSLRSAGEIATAPAFRGIVEAVGADALAGVGASDLARDPFAYVLHPRHVAKAVADAREAASQPPLRLALLGSWNVDTIAGHWQAALAQLLPERRLSIWHVPFGQMQQEILDPASSLNAEPARMRVFCDRIEDILPRIGGDSQDAAASAHAYADLIERAHASGGWSVVHRLAALRPDASSEGARSAGVLAAELNAVLDDRLRGLNQLLWVDLAAEAAAHDGAVLDDRLWYLGRIPFSASFSARLAQRWAGLVLAALGKTARVVVLDLDNTLWGGVLGEDGMAGVSIGGDYPGNAFADFQAALLALTRRGIALAVASKNDEDLALKAFRDLPFMAIREKDLTTSRINWEPKWRNIQEIADELNLGLDSVLFVDDNPVEREQVRQNLPGVKIVELPADPTGYRRAIEDSPYLAAATVTDEDRQRVQSFGVRKRLVAAEKSASLDDFLMSLGMMLHFKPLSALNAQRAAQLCQKTNQFNSTTRRYDVRDLERLADEGADVVVIGLEDKNSPFENIGLAILRPTDDGEGTIDLYLLSCRVLGRGIETAVPRWALGRAATRGWTALRGQIIETERNTPVRSVYADAGFDSESEGWWTATPSAVAPSPWLTIIDEFAMQEVTA